MGEQTLRKILWADAYASGASVLFTIAGAALLGDWLDISAWIPGAVCLVLIPWVGFLVMTVRRPELRPAEVATVVAGNIGWAAAAAVIIVGFPDSLSTGGKWIVGIFSLGVLDFGVAQWLGLRRLADRGLPEVARPS